MGSPADFRATTTSSRRCRLSGPVLPPRRLPAASPIAATSTSSARPGLISEPRISIRGPTNEFLYQRDETSAQTFVLDGGGRFYQGNPVGRGEQLLYVQAFGVQTSHAAISNAQAKMDIRLARWLLVAHDRISAHTLPPLTAAWPPIESLDRHEAFGARNFL